MKSTREISRVADELDARRRAQIANQIDSINRLLEDGSYDSEMAHLHEDLAHERAKNEQLEADVVQLKVRIKELESHG